MYTYDKTIKVGDLITSYRKGFYRVVEIERRYYTDDDETSFDFLEKQSGHRPHIGDERNPRVISRKILNTKYNKSVGIDSCDATFCSKIDLQTKLKIERILEADPRIEEDSKKKYANPTQKKSPPVISNDEIREMEQLLSECNPGQSVEKVLETISPKLFAGIELANGFVNSGKQFSVHLNEHYSISVIYDEVPNMITEFVSGTITKKIT
jgi:hypothetical protein